MGMTDSQFKANLRKVRALIDGVIKSENADKEKIMKILLTFHLNYYIM
jgi:hypothetical protein